MLADGACCDGLTALRKDNTGYDVKALFLGAEGTLGVITAATSSCSRRCARAPPRSSRWRRAARRGAARATAQASGERVSSFELIPRLAIELTVRHISAVRDPLARAHPWYVLCELTSARADEPLRALLEQIPRPPPLAAGLVRDARHREQRARARSGFWRLRETIPAAQRLAGASLKHDISRAGEPPAGVHRRGRAWVAGHVPRWPADRLRPRGRRQPAFQPQRHRQRRQGAALSGARAADHGAPYTIWCASSAAASAPSTASGG